MRASLSAAPGIEYHAGRFGSELLLRRPPSSEIVPKLLFSGTEGGSNCRTLVDEGVRRILTLGLESLSLRDGMGLRSKSRARCAALAKGESVEELVVEGPAAVEDEGSTGIFSKSWSLLSASLWDRKRRISRLGQGWRRSGWCLSRCYQVLLTLKEMETSRTKTLSRGIARSDMTAAAVEKTWKRLYDALELELLSTQHSTYSATMAICGSEPSGAARDGFDSNLNRFE